MGKLKHDFLSSRDIKPSVWFRFLDDIFIIWDGFREELDNHLRDINNFHPNRTFTYKVSPESVDC
jgi:hypothetical protein